MQQLIPAIIPSSSQHLEESLMRVHSFAHEVQVDIVDGVFVPFRSWPYVGSGSVSLLSRYTEEYSIEVDLMVKNPEDVISVYSDAGVDSIVIHLESTGALETICEHRALHSYKLGLSIDNDTPLSVLTDQIAHADYVQLMGIAHIGSQGQPFDERVLSRIRILRDAYPELVISIDGSVNAESLGKLVEAGANQFVCGSAILNADNPENAYDTLEQRIKG